MRLYNFSILFVLSVTIRLTGGKCTKKTSCSCTMDDGKVINLAGLKKLTANDSVNKNNYVYKPCQTFDIGGLTGVTFVQYNGTSGKYSDIGSDPNVDFNEETGGNEVELIITSQAKDKKSNVLLSCSDKETGLTFTSQYPPGSFNFRLDSPYCCPGYKPSGGGGSGGLSFGSILLIIFFVVLILYVVLGVLYKVKVKHAEGPDRIPNVMFWAALPGLIKDGFIFTITCNGKNTVYSQI